MAAMVAAATASLPMFHLVPALAVRHIRLLHFGREGRAMSYETIIVETRGRVGIIRLNRPQALNALNNGLFVELTRAVAAFEADDGIGCLLLTGSEKAFAAGADIKEMADKSYTDASKSNWSGNWDPVAHAHKPVVAA